MDSKAVGEEWMARKEDLTFETAGFPNKKTPQCGVF